MASRLPDWGSIWEQSAKKAGEGRGYSVNDQVVEERLVQIEKRELRHDLAHGQLGEEGQRLFELR